MGIIADIRRINKRKAELEKKPVAKTVPKKAKAVPKKAPAKKKEE